MNKKQRNRKLVAQNKRNRIINRRYSSTIKTLFKLFTFKIKTVKADSIEKDSKEIKVVVNNLYSVIDKAIKKDVIHKNNAARKKSRISRILAKIS